MVPIFKKYLYTLMPPSSDKKIILKEKIQSVTLSQIVINEKIKRIKGFSAGKLSLKDLENIDDKGWQNIISNNLNNPSNAEGLKNLLINYGYKSMDVCVASNVVDKTNCAKKITKAVKYIQRYTTQLVGLQLKLKESVEEMEVLVEEMSRANTMNKSRVLLREPVYLKNSKNIGDFDTQKIDNFGIEHNYNYAISCWVFLRANNLKRTVSEEHNYKSILNYGGKPNIMYNSTANKLKISMNNGINKKPKEFIIEDMVLQKWTNIVVNYDSSVLDIFMDSKLLASFNNIVPYMSQDQITVGDLNGVSGGICNVVYFPQSISKERIDINYNILSNKNPPIV